MHLPVMIWVPLSQFISVVLVLLFLVCCSYGHSHVPHNSFFRISSLPNLVNLALLLDVAPSHCSKSKRFGLKTCSSHLKTKLKLFLREQGGTMGVCVLWSPREGCVALRALVWLSVSHQSPNFINHDDLVTLGSPLLSGVDIADQIGRHLW